MIGERGPDSETSFLGAVTSRLHLVKTSTFLNNFVQDCYFWKVSAAKIEEIITATFVQYQKSLLRDQQLQFDWWQPCHVLTCNARSCSLSIAFQFLKCCSFSLEGNSQFDAQISAADSYRSGRWQFTSSITKKYIYNACVHWDRVDGCDCLSKSTGSLFYIQWKCFILIKPHSFLWVRSTFFTQ